MTATLILLPPFPPLTGADLIALDFFLPTPSQICISGARPGGIRFKKNLLHIQKLILSSVPSLGADSLQPETHGGFRSRGRSSLFLTSRSICWEDQLSVLSASGSFK